MALSSTSGQGRPRGVPNRATRDIKALAQKHGAKAIAELARIAFNSEDDKTKVVALKELLDRGYGKPAQSIEHTGADGGPIKTEEVSKLEIARRVAFLLASGADAAKA